MLLRSFVTFIIVFFISSFIYSQENYQRPIVGIYTSKGDFFLELYYDIYPKTVSNFLQYVEDGFYDNTLIHRVLSKFIVQGGGFSVDYTYKPTRQSLWTESSKKVRNIRGTIAMAKTIHDHSAKSQFFLNVVDNPEFDYQSRNKRGYAVFGHVIQGIEILDKISTVKTHSYTHIISPEDSIDFDHLPKKPIVVYKVVLQQDGFYAQ